MKHLSLLLACVLMSLAVAAQRTIVVQKGSVESLLEAISTTNQWNAELDAERTYILIPDGYYDLGDRMLTRISGHNVALIGQSMEGTVIRNKPDIKIESISPTDVR